MHLEGNYNYVIIALSILIAILASYSALNITAKISRANGMSRFFWLVSGALVMGSGIWSMHFVGMLGFSLHTEVKYEVSLTLLSLLASVGASFIAFYITIPKDVNWYKISIGGCFMGGGIVAMHYIGMEAMIMSAQLTYDKVLAILSVVIALVVSFVALLLFLRFRNQPKSIALKWASAIVMGLAVCGMHYTGMEAAQFHDHGGVVIEHNTANNPFLLYGVTTIVFFILFISWVAMFFDRHVLERMAYKDNITGLSNRNEMNRFFDTHTGNEPIGVLFLDLDQFKAINDTLGHNIGDMLVREVGHRLSQFVTDSIKAFRIGGDEFLLIMMNYDQQQVEQLAKTVLLSIKKAYHIEQNEMYVTGSIGISMGTVLSSDRSRLLQEADTAMYRAKGLGKNQYCLYNEELGTQETLRMELEKDLPRALEKSQFYLLYQPKWNVKINRLYGFEALIRWNHPRLGIIPPLDFISIAEETGYIIPMTRWTLEKACRQCKEWQMSGIIQPVSVNLSIRLFQTDNLSELIESVLEKVDLDPHLLELEITETMVLYDIKDIARQLHRIRALGVRVSMDDFGTGYSSIGLLDQIPIDALKLDRLFTNDLDTPSKKAIISAIILMAEQLGLDVIAEGVENQEHIDFLTELGCKVMQGYFYGKPMSNIEIDEWMKNIK